MKHPILTLTKLNALVRATWPDCGGLDVATYYTWQGPAAYLYPHVTAALCPDGLRTPRQLLQALVSRAALAPGTYVILVTERDLGGPHG